MTLDSNGTLYVADFNNARVMKITSGSLNGTPAAGTTSAASSASNQLRDPAEIAVDANFNLYVNDNLNYRVMLWRKNASSGSRVVDTGSSGSSLNTIGESIRLVMDSQGNIYVSDKGNHRVMKWAPNATSGTIVAGTGTAGSSSQQLNNPYGLYLDQILSYLYIADWSNHRI